MKRLIECFGIGWSLAMGIFFTICLWVSAFQAHPFEIHFPFNRYYEGIPEMILFPLFTLAGIYAFVMSFKRMFGEKPVFIHSVRPYKHNLKDCVRVKWNGR